jgi:hypothetical protein
VAIAKRSQRRPPRSISVVGNRERFLVSTRRAPIEQVGMNTSGAQPAQKAESLRQVQDISPIDQRRHKQPRQAVSAIIAQSRGAKRACCGRINDVARIGMGTVTVDSTNKCCSPRGNLSLDRGSQHRRLSLAQCLRQAGRFRGQFRHPLHRPVLHKRQGCERAIPVPHYHRHV